MVKVNAQSICDKVIKSLKITVEIKKLGFISDHEVIKTVKEAPRELMSNEEFKNEDTFAICTSSKETTYYGVAYASAIIDGKPMRTLKVLSAHNGKLRCGT